MSATSSGWRWRRRGDNAMATFQHMSLQYAQTTKLLEKDISDINLIHYWIEMSHLSIACTKLEPHLQN
jgi:hypothetical protein